MAALGLLLPVTALTVSPSSAAGSCTIVGTSGPDRLVGTARDDIICGRGGDDVLVGRGGNDIFNDGPGRDVVRGGDGNDRLVTDAPGGKDLYEGNAGTDRVWYLDRTAAVRVSLDDVANDGGTGEGDNIRSDVEWVTGTEYADVLTGSDAADVLDGTWGDDLLKGGGGDDRLLGGADFDELWGGDGDDKLLGGTYNDALSGGGGADVMDGQGTMTPYENVCDADPADTTSRCALDGEVPAVDLRPAKQAVSPGETLRMDARVLDTAGARSVGIELVRSSDGQVMSGCPAQMTPYMDEFYRPDSDWKWRCVLPADLAPGGYVLRPTAVDRLGLQRPLGSTGYGDTGLVVLGPEAESDPPVGQVLGVSDAELQPGDEFTVQVAASDASGVVHLSPSVQVGQVVSSEWCNPYSATLTSGSILDGTWDISCTVPQLVRNGDYSLRSYLVDGRDNSGETADTDPLFTVTGGTDDAAPPVVSQLDAPSTVARGEQFTVTARASDASGVRIIAPMLDPAHQGEYPCSSMERTAGTNKDGTWSVTCTMTETWPPGTYTLYIYATDALGHHVYTKDIPDGLTVTLTVT